MLHDGIVCFDSNTIKTAHIIAHALQGVENVDVVAIVTSQGCYGENWHVFAKYISVDIHPDELDDVVSDALLKAK